MSTATSKVEHECLVHEIEDVFIVRDFVEKAKKQEKRVEVQIEQTRPVLICSLHDLNGLYHETFFLLKYGSSTEPLSMTISFVD